MRGYNGIPGRDEEQDPPGPQGPQSPHDPTTHSVVVYTRWGRTTYPSGQRTELVYSGKAGGTYYNHQGGAANYLCMADDPQYSTYPYASGIQSKSHVYGVNYRMFSVGRYNHYGPCAGICHVRERGSGGSRGVSTVSAETPLELQIFFTK